MSSPLRITTAADLETARANHDGLLLYVEGPSCNVCRAMLPKVSAMLDAFPDVHMAMVDAEAAPDITAQLGIFSVPTVVLFIDGRESIRKARSWAMGDLRMEIARLVELRFG